VHKRSGVGRKPVVQPVQPRGGQALERASATNLNKGRTWLTTKQHLRRGGDPAGSALYHARAICSLSSEWSRKLVMARECNCVALRAAILSGFPTITTPTFSQCPISGPIPFVGTHDRRPRQMPLAREDIPHISHLVSSTPPPGPDVISQLRSLVFAQGWGAVWRVRGEYFFGGTGRPIRREDRFVRM
jgi:hypothetical protein